MLKTLLDVLRSGGHRRPPPDLRFLLHRPVFCGTNGAPLTPHSSSEERNHEVTHPGQHADE